MGDSLIRSGIYLFFDPFIFRCLYFFIAFEWHDTVNTLIGHSKEYLISIFNDNLGNL